EIETKVVGPAQGIWLERLELEHDNLRAALAWSLKCSDECGVMSDEFGVLTHHSSLITHHYSEAALRLCGALQRFWQGRGHLWEGRRWYAAVLSRTANQAGTQARAKALNGAGVLANFQGDYAAACAYFEESLSIRREIGDKQGIADSLVGLGNMTCFRGD